MTIPPANAPIWAAIVTGKCNYKFEYLAANLLQGTLARSLSNDPSPANLRKCCAALRELFVCNADQPLLQNDLKQLTAKEAFRGA